MPGLEGGGEEQPPQQVDPRQAPGQLEDEAKQASYPAGALSDRWPRHRVYAAGLAFFAVGYLGLGLVENPGWVFVLLPLYGGFAACTDGVGKAWVASLSPPDRQGATQGLYQAVAGGSVLVAGLWAGLLWGGNGRFPLVLAGSVAAAGAVALALRGGRLGQQPVSSGVPPRPGG